MACTPRFAAVPTYGCFVRGYLLVVPRRHVLAFGQLDPGELAEAQILIDDLVARLKRVYGLPVLGFEYGLAAAGVRRIEHAHWHLVPSPADLAGWLDERLAGRRIGSLVDLPAAASYIAVRTSGAGLRLYDVGHTADATHEVHSRIRLRRALAALDPRVDDGAWDWAEQRHVELIRATVAELGAHAEPAAHPPAPTHTRQPRSSRRRS
ncbi:HIT domain-containing protein [Spirillospora sp. NPDC047279]|uniref:HIT family protein n=1 Tax=Spirillospora sp. NPDC047279 TaxID=3155478 RepID=UPI0033C02509